MKNYFADNLKYLRKISGLSQDALSEKINKTVENEEDKIHRSTIGRYENGNREPSVGNVLTIAEFFRVPIADIIAKDVKNDGKIKESLEIELLRKTLLETGFMKSKDDLTDDEFDRLNKICKELLNRDK